MQLECSFVHATVGHGLDRDLLDMIGLYLVERHAPLQHRCDSLLTLVVMSLLGATRARSALRDVELFGGAPLCDVILEDHHRLLLFSFDVVREVLAALNFGGDGDVLRIKAHLVTTEF